MSDTVREIQAGQFEAEVHAATEPAVLDFFSTECPVLRQVAIRGPSFPSDATTGGLFLVADANAPAA
jgi:hypothetical protein